MRISFLVESSLFLAFGSFVAVAAEPTLDNKVNLTVTSYGDHIQFDCNPVSLDSAERNDWKVICNQMAAVQAQKLAAAGTIAPVKGSVFDLSAPESTGPLLSKSIAMAKLHL